MTLPDELLELQFSQLQHDELYHKDIVLLPVGERLKHMTLHFAKYVGAFGEAIESNDVDRMRRTLVDAFVISLACSNILNIDLGKEFAQGTDAKGFRELGTQFAAKLERPAEDGYWFLRRLAHHTGKMAKACESLDHLEEFDYRKILHEHVLGIVRLVLAESSARNLDIVEASRTRLRKLEGNNIFDKHLTRIRKLRE